MSVEKGKISNLQLMFLIIAFVQGSGLLLTFIDSITEHDAWIVIISAFLPSLVFIMAYIALAQMFPGSNLIEINDIIYGSYLGKFLSILYFGFFLILLSLNLRILADFYVDFIMPEMPMIFFLIIFTLVCAYAVQNGIETIARMGFVMVVLSFLIVIFTVILLLKDIKLANFLPVFEIPLNRYFQGIHIVATIHFCEIFVFLMVMSSVNKIKHLGRYSLMGLSLSALFILAISVRNTAVLGVLLPTSIASAYQVTRLINIGDFLTRMEVLIAVGITTALFMKTIVIYYATVLSLAQITRLRSYPPLILPIGSIAVCLAWIIYDSTIEHNFYAINYHAVYATLFEIIMPLLSLLIAKIRGFPKQEPVNLTTPAKI